MKIWLLLVLAIMLEICGTSLLKVSDGFSRLLPAIGALFCYSFSFYLLSLILRSLPVGIAYALWSGVGIIGISLIGWFFMNQKLDAAAMAGIALIIAGVLVINLFSQSGAH